MVTASKQLNTPEHKSSYRAIFPIVTTRQSTKWSRFFLSIAKSYGCSSKFRDFLRFYLETVFFPPVCRYGGYLEEIGKNGSLNVQTKLSELRSKVLKTIRSQGFDPYIAEHELNEETLSLVLDQIQENLNNSEQRSIGGPDSEGRWATLVKAVLAVPVTFMVSKAMGFSTNSSLLLTLGQIGFAVGMGVINKLALRPVAEAAVALGATSIPGVTDNTALSKKALKMKLAVFGALNLAVIGFIATLDAVFIQQMSSMTPFGKAAQNAISFPVALAMAGVFSGLLSTVNFALAWKDCERAEISKRITQRIQALNSSIAPHFCEVEKTQNQLEIEQAREAEFAAAADAQWFKLCYAMLGVCSKANESQIQEFLLTSSCMIHRDVQECPDSNNRDCQTRTSQYIQIEGGD